MIRYVKLVIKKFVARINSIGITRINIPFVVVFIT